MSEASTSSRTPGRRVAESGHLQSRGEQDGGNDVTEGVGGVKFTGIYWGAVIAGASMAVASHPFAFAKTLIQLGYEPLEPIMRRSDKFPFKETLLYPHVFAYLGHIKARDGFMGLFRGAGPRVLANSTMTVAYARMKVNLQIADIDPATQSYPRDLGELSSDLAKESVARCTAVIVSHPFHVVAVRCMASFVGDNQLFASPIACIKQTLKEEGIFGFFSGVVPRIFMEILAMWLTEMFAHVINTYILVSPIRGLIEPLLHKVTGGNRDLRSYTTMVTKGQAGSNTYPLSLVSIVMICNGTPLDLGNMPYNPVYIDWMHCFSDMKCRGIANRGGSLLFRAPVIPDDKKPCPTPATHVVTTPSLPPPSVTITELPDIPVEPAPVE